MVTATTMGHIISRTRRRCLQTCCVCGHPGERAAIQPLSQNPLHEGLLRVLCDDCVRRGTW